MGVIKQMQWLEFPGLGYNSAMPRRYYDELSAFLDGSTVTIAFSKTP